MTGEGGGGVRRATAARRTGSPLRLPRWRLVSARTRRPLVGAGEKEGGREGLQLSLDGGKVSREHQYMI